MRQSVVEVVDVVVVEVVDVVVVLSVFSRCWGFTLSEPGVGLCDTIQSRSRSVSWSGGFLCIDCPDLAVICQSLYMLSQETKSSFRPRLS